MNMKLILTLLSTFVILSGCASPNEVDFSKADPDCSQKCHSNYSNCLSAFTLFPIQQNNQCVDGLKACAMSCPAKGTANPPEASKLSTPNLSMEQAKAKCIDLGFKTGTESFGQCVLKMTK